MPNAIALRYVTKLASDLRILTAMVERVNDKVAQFIHHYTKPLNAMQAELELVEQDLPGSDLGREHKDRIAFIRYRLHYFAQLNHQLAWEGRVLAGWHPEPARENVSVQELLHGTKLQYLPYCKSRSIDFQVTEESESRICVDKQWMFNVFDNLVMNAVEAIEQQRPPLREIRLWTDSSDPGTVSILLHNSAVKSDGLPSNEHPGVLPIPRPRLGQAFCHEIVTHLGGHLDLSALPDAYEVRISFPANATIEGDRHG